MIDNVQYHSASHCKYLTQYHVVWCTKYRYRVLVGEVKNNLKDILMNICKEHDYIVKALEVMPEHIHIFVDCKQTVAPCDIARILKSKSAIEMFKSNSKLKDFYARCSSLWSDGYFISTVGKVSETTIKTYIDEQNLKKWVF